jgi:UDP-3-O-[3-hydroxymyristoyl] glucosamine N-acyltransferase
MGLSAGQYENELAGRGTEGYSVVDFLRERGFEYSAEGDPDIRISGVASLCEATSGDLAFCSTDGDRAQRVLGESGAGVILCKKQLKGLVGPKKGTQFIFLDNPRRMFVVIANALKSAIEEKKKGGRTFISPSASIASGSRIGNNCKIGSNVIVGENCVVGDNCEIHDRVTLAQNCRLGKNCVIQSGVTLGEDGFAHERHENSRLEKFPHFKGVVIGDNVEICANTNIARGSLTDTIIGEGTKIDALVHIAHNASVGKNCMLTAGTIIGGSAVIGDSCWTGLNSTVKDHARVGNNVIVGAGACVIHDIPDGDIVAGVPAKSIRHKVTASDVFLMAGQKKDTVGQID